MKMMISNYLIGTVWNHLMRLIWILMKWIFGTGGKTRKGSIIFMSRIFGTKTIHWNYQMILISIKFLIKKQKTQSRKIIYSGLINPLPLIMRNWDLPVQTVRELDTSNLIVSKIEILTLKKNIKISFRISILTMMFKLMTKLLTITWKCASLI